MLRIFCDRDVCKDILHETALIMLESEERDENFSNKEAWKLSVLTYVGKMIENLVIFP